MTTSLSKAVQEAIQKDLPGLAAGELKDFIAQAEQTAKELERTKTQLIDANRNISSLESDLKKHAALDEKQRKLDATAAEQQTKELELLKREAGLEAKVAKAELTGVKETLIAFLKNPTVRTEVQSTLMKPVDGVAPSSSNGYNNPGCPGTLLTATDKTVTTETKE